MLVRYVRFSIPINETFENYAHFSVKPNNYGVKVIINFNFFSRMCLTHKVKFVIIYERYEELIFFQQPRKSLYELFEES